MSVDTVRVVLVGRCGDWSEGLGVSYLGLPWGFWAHRTVGSTASYLATICTAAAGKATTCSLAYHGENLNPSRLTAKLVTVVGLARPDTIFTAVFCDASACRCTATSTAKPKPDRIRMRQKLPPLDPSPANKAPSSKSANSHRNTQRMSKPTDPATKRQRMMDFGQKGGKQGGKQQRSGSVSDESGVTDTTDTEWVGGGYNAGFVPEEVYGYETGLPALTNNVPAISLVANSEAIDLGPLEFCEHNMPTNICIICTGQKCTHGHIKGLCGECAGLEVCMHQKTRNKCSHCRKLLPFAPVIPRAVELGDPNGYHSAGGNSLSEGEGGTESRPWEKVIYNPEGRCVHQLVFTNCRECKRLRKYCEHGRIRASCLECRGCVHGIIRAFCKECGGSGLCPHNIKKKNCRSCSLSFCEHGRKRKTCLECGGQHLCMHDRWFFSCKYCRAENLCRHAIRRDCCEDPKCRSKKCMHGVLLVNCEDCAADKRIDILKKLAMLVGVPPP